MRGVTAMVGLTLGFAAHACTFGPVGSGGASAGDDSADGATDGTTGAMTTMAPTTLGGMQTTGADDDTTAAPETGDVDSDGDSGSGRPAGLVQDGVVARYYLDEAEEGQTPTAARDAVEPAVDLPMQYAGANPRYHTENGHRGLEWDTHEVGGGPHLPYGGTKFLAELETQPSATLEVVAHIRTVTNLSSRILHFGEGEGSGDLTLATTSIGKLQLRLADGPPSAEWSVDLANTGRAVFTIVFDSSQRDVTRRARLFVDGAEVDASAIDGVETSQPITLSPGGSIALGNRAIGERSFEGILYYAAVYDRPLTPEEVASNATLLLEDDDSP